ncbi:MAG: Hsp20/alpha crystallin family protein [Myxococcota bacterium]
MTQVLRNPFRQPVREEGTRPGPVYRPDADILERADEYLVLVDVPGADEQSLQVRFEKDVLTIEASPAAAPEPSWAPRHAEYQPGGYAREFRIADGIEVEAIRASLKNGVLELHLPKTGSRRPRTIQVAAA